MLCCGLLALLAAAAAGLWRRLREAPWVLAAAALVAGPVLAITAGAPLPDTSRADAIARAMHSWCGSPRTP